jgi:hypothetical protein
LPFISGYTREICSCQSLTLYRYDVSYLTQCLELISVKNDHEYVLLVVNTSRSFPHSCFITRFVTRLTRLVPLVEQQQLTLQEHPNSSPVFSGVRVQSLTLYRYDVSYLTQCLFLCFYMHEIVNYVYILHSNWAKIHKRILTNIQYIYYFVLYYFFVVLLACKSVDRSTFCMKCVYKYTAYIRKTDGVYISVPKKD